MTWITVGLLSISNLPVEDCSLNDLSFENKVTF